MVLSRTSDVALLCHGHQLETELGHSWIVSYRKGVDEVILQLFDEQLDSFGKRSTTSSRSEPRGSKTRELIPRFSLFVERSEEKRH